MAFFLSRLFAALALAWPLSATTLAADTPPTATGSHQSHANEPAGQPSKPPVSVSFWVGDTPEARSAYERELIKEILEHTRDQFGGYELKIDRMPRSQERLARDLSRGDGNFVINGPGWSTAAPTGATPDATIIEIPLVKGLLGYRQCIIRRSDEARFAELRTWDALQEIRMGQGQTWLDHTILEQNGFTVLGAPDIEKLYYMLKRGRFDCLPLGIGEAAGSLADNDKDNELTIAADLLLFYPLPVFMQVSGRDSPLAKRLETGLRTLQNNGVFDQLFDKHYRDEIIAMNAPDVRVFRLENPLLPRSLRHVGQDLIKSAK